MKFAVIQHTKDSPAGSTLDWLNLHNHPYDHYRIYENPIIPEFESFEALIICGGAMNVDDEAKYEWMPKEKKLIHRCLKSKKRMMGLCLGGQLIAEALGARVSRHPHWEVGWQDVNLKAIHSTDIPAVGSKLKVFQWHGYSFDTPAGAESFASNEICTHQGYCYQGHAIGLQFHPETTKEWARECAADPDLPPASKSLPGTQSIQTPEQILAGIPWQAELQAWYFSLLGSFFRR